jgi:hypothetical protein
MGAESGEQPPAPAADGGDKKPASNDDDRKSSYGGRRNQRNRDRANKQGGNNNTIHIPKEKLIGRSEDLKGYIFDVVHSNGGVAYTRTSEEIARHVGEKYTTTGSFVRTAILTLVVPVPTRPTAPIATGNPAAIDPVDGEIFREEIRMFVKTRAAIGSGMKSLYDLIWGQCSESLRSRLRGFDDYPKYSQNVDSLTLLKGIRAEMTGFRNKQYLSHALHKPCETFTTWHKENTKVTKSTMTSSTPWY